MVEGLNSFHVKVMSDYMVSHGLERLIKWMKRNAVAFAKFSLRIIFGDFPEDYWRRAVKLRFPEYYKEFAKWIRFLESDLSLQDNLIDFIAEYLVNDINEIQSADIPYLPSSGTILDIGSGYLGISKKLVAEALRHKSLFLYLIDNAELPFIIMNKVLGKLGKPNNIRALRVSADALPFEDNSVEAITLLGALHELSKDIYMAELYRSFGTIRVNNELLEKARKDYDAFLKEFCRVLKENGVLIIIDKIMDRYDLDYVISLTEPYFDIINRERKENSFTLVGRK